MTGRSVSLRLQDEDETQAGTAPNRRKAIVVVAALVVVVVVAIAGFAIYRDRVEPLNRTVLKVDDTSISMDYFLDRALLLPDYEPLEVLQTLAFEQIIISVATKAPYNITATDDEVEALLRARAEAGTAMDDAEFDEWYRSRLNETGLSSDEFDGLVRTQLITVRLAEYLASRTSTVDEQVHLYMIMTPSLETAAVAKARLDGGEDFLVLARELNPTAETRDNGGEIGWFPRDALEPFLARQAFDVLDIGTPSDPMGLQGGVFAVVLVAEREAAREIDEASLDRVRTVAVERWVQAEYGNHVVTTHGLTEGWDAETDAWVKLQLQRRRQR